MSHRHSLNNTQTQFPERHTDTAYWMSHRHSLNITDTVSWTSYRHSLNLCGFFFVAFYIVGSLNENELAKSTQ